MPARQRKPSKAEVDPRIDKRRVTMRSARVTGVDDDGKPVVRVDEAVDHIRPDYLEAYEAHARQNWQFVEVSDEPDAGPGGYHGQTVIPHNIDHPLAGQIFPATKEA